jgi:hypothetical protein
MNYNTLQEGFLIMERLGALCATSGITEETQKMANEHIQTILKSVIQQYITELGAKSAGLVL